MALGGNQPIAPELEALPRRARKLRAQQHAKQPIRRIGHTHAPGFPQAHGARRDLQQLGALLGAEAVGFSQEPQAVGVTEVAPGRPGYMLKFFPLGHSGGRVSRGVA